MARCYISRFEIITCVNQPPFITTSSGHKTTSENQLIAIKVRGSEENDGTWGDC